MACPFVAKQKIKQLDQPVEGWSKTSATEATLRARALAREQATIEADDWLNAKEAQHPCPDTCNNTRRRWVYGFELVDPPVRRRWKFDLLFVFVFPIIVSRYVFVAKFTATWVGRYACSEPGQPPLEYEDDEDQDE